jgi:hypothetical protein
MLRRWIFLSVIVAGGMSTARARGQSCPPAYASCDNGGCCPSSDQCCPTVDQGCCSSYAPYCCGNGTCAVSPSHCAPEAARCAGYDLPCGGGCAPAGADCCDGEGRYCPPGSLCKTASTCAVGDASPLSALRTTPGAAKQQSQTRVISPLSDPSDASARSCAVAASSGGSGSRILMIATLTAFACARSRRRARLRRECSRSPSSSPIRKRQWPFGIVRRRARR